MFGVLDRSFVDHVGEVAFKRAEGGQCGRAAVRADPARQHGPDRRCGGDLPARWTADAHPGPAGRGRMAGRDRYLIICLKGVMNTIEYA